MYNKLFEDINGRQVITSNTGGLALSRDLKIDDSVSEFTLEISEVDNLLSYLDSFIKSSDSCIFMYNNEGISRILNKGIEVVISLYHIEIHQFKSFRSRCNYINKDELMRSYKKFLEYYNNVK